MPRTEAGFTYVWALAVIAVLSIGLAQIGPIWADDMRREREQELLRIGGLYAEAIASYHQASPGTLKQYPKSLSDLLLDTRYLGIRRHLRRLYTDPMVPGQPLALIRGEDGAIRGVYSTDPAPPLRREALQVAGVELPANARSYADWQFAPKPATKTQQP